MRSALVQVSHVSGFLVTFHPSFHRRGWCLSLAFSLLELLVSIAVLAALAAVIVVGYASFKARAEKAKCIGNMRTLHSCLHAYVGDVGRWPQFPEEEEFNENTFYRFFTAALEPYGSSRELWLCPSDKVDRYLTEEERKADDYFGSYVPSAFDRYESSPFRWNQPWLVEKANFHGDGAHIVMPDGSISTTRNPFYGR